MVRPERSVHSDSKAGLSIWQVIGSVLASFFGVQSYGNRKRDFESGKARDFVIVGFVMTILCCLLIGSLVWAVTWLAK